MPNNPKILIESTKDFWERAQQLKTDLRALVKSGAVVISEVDLKQGGLLNVGIKDDSSNGCTVIALMIYALFYYGLFNCYNFISVIQIWASPVLKIAREPTGDELTFVETEPALDILQSIGLISRQVSLGIVECGGIFDHEFVSKIIGPLTIGNGVLLLINEHTTILFLQHE